ncbi:hypothetical protein E1B28_010659 [Marasmius oreades]|uniref:MARVEL domain-containing protein n=1 Tax=Marasmius oreades TaxID=181124 RepID=A0A9P7URQ4_9AGAR|nr:uncharacterized protein E1B28_010659 [Marasmius oreades]KAG7091638.1 hypothetical protein E1B28_010659 [Marasmius oreades]
MTGVGILRVVVLAIAILFSIPTLALTAHLTSLTEARIVYDFEGLGIAVSALTLLCVPVFLIVGFLRKGSWFTMNVVEVPVLGGLSIIWLATGSLYANWENQFYPPSFSCDSRYLTPYLQTFCSEFRAIEALSFIIWITLMIYAIVAIILCLVGKSRGNDVWLLGANEADYFTRRKHAGGPVMGQPQYAGQAPPQPVVQPQVQQHQAPY